MDTATLRQRLTDILNEEERPNVDWNAVEGFAGGSLTTSTITEPGLPPHRLSLPV